MSLVFCDFNSDLSIFYWLIFLPLHSQMMFTKVDLTARLTGVAVVCVRPWFLLACLVLLGGCGPTR